MRILPFAAITLVLLMFTRITSVAASLPGDGQVLAVVPELDLERYAGQWYEISRFPNRFQRGCAGEVTATYSLRPDGRIAVTNRCRQANGEMKEAEGVARRVEGRPASVLKVRFAPAFLGFLPMVWGDYQVIALGPDYDFAVVGTPDRKYLWILARTPAMEPGRYKAAVEAARAQGFEVGRLMQTQQEGAP
jgi:apolipoprotein D and lipocalin family protein